MRSVVASAAEDACRPVPSTRTAADSAPQPQAPPCGIPSAKADAIIALHCTVWGCAEACVRLAAAVAAAASSSQAWHLDFRIGQRPSVC